jgi:hypothetical protein
MKVHSSDATTTNPKFRELSRRSGESNVEWLERALATGSDAHCSIVLLGGAGLSDFRLRVAQSEARSDLLPSYWSHVAILSDRRRLALHEVSLEPGGGFRNVPQTQGIRAGRFHAYDDAGLFPNVGVVHWKLNSPPGGLPADKAIDQVIVRLVKDRGAVDLLTPLWHWLGYIWGVGDTENPLPGGTGIPSAVLVEAVFAMLGIELTPGLASQSSCPEAIWQATKWWARYYDSAASLTDGPPWGAFVVDQPAAAVTAEWGSAAGKKPAAKRRKGARKAR